MTDTTTATSEPFQAVGAPVERPVRPDVAEALRIAEKMMRDSWATGNDAAWQPARQELAAHLEKMSVTPTDQQIAAAWRSWPQQGITSAAKAICFVRWLMA